MFMMMSWRIGAIFESGISTALENAGKCKGLHVLS